MILVIGGAFSGRHKVAKDILKKRKFKKDFCDIREISQIDAENFEKEKELLPGEIPPHFFPTIMKISSFSVAIATEMGCGIVPIIADEREKREQNGALNIALASVAAAVVLVVAGIPRVIKGDLETALSMPLLFLFRHGRTKANAERRFAGGLTDCPLCEDGEIEAASFSKNLESKLDGFQEDVKNALLFPKIVFSSPMNRAVRTAEIFFPNSRIQKIEDFREMKLGLFENQTHEELICGKFADGTFSSENAKKYQTWLDSGGKNAPPSSKDFPSESIEEFTNRTVSALKNTVLTQESPVITIFCHGGVQMSLCSKCFFGSENFVSFVWQSQNAEFRFGAADFSK